jgi:hypothetical protein
MYVHMERIGYMADRAAELLTKIKKNLPCPKRIWTNNKAELSG